jgi:hypothetical protein
MAITPTLNSQSDPGLEAACQTINETPIKMHTQATIRTRSMAFMITILHHCNRALAPIGLDS